MSTIIKRQKRCLASLIQFTFQIIRESFFASRGVCGPYYHRNKNSPTRMKSTFSTDFHKGIHHLTEAYLAIRYWQGEECPQLLLLISENWHSELYLVQRTAKVICTLSLKYSRLQNWKVQFKPKATALPVVPNILTLYLLGQPRWISKMNGSALTDRGSIPGNHLIQNLQFHHTLSQTLSPHPI